MEVIERLGYFFRGVDKFNNFPEFADKIKPLIDGGDQVAIDFQVLTPPLKRNSIMYLAQDCEGFRYGVRYMAKNGSKLIAVCMENYPLEIQANYSGLKRHHMEERCFATAIWRISTLVKVDPEILDDLSKRKIARLIVN